MRTKLTYIIAITFLFTACTTSTVTTAAPAQPSPDTVIPTAPALTISQPATVLPTIAPTEKTSTQRISPIDGMPLVYVPAGNVRMGGLDIHADDRDELPAHDVSLNAFWIDKLEVTNAMYMLCVQSNNCTSPLDWATNSRPSYFNNEEFKDYPVVHITWDQATIFCDWANRRLPTEAEWERAARGDDFRNFPWGDEPPSELYANFNRLVDETSRVGSYNAGASPFGALDMAGNIWEWVADLYGVEYYKISPEHNPAGPESNTTSLRVIRGGSYQDNSANLRVSKRGAALGPNSEAPYNTPNREGEHSSKIGFRCVSDDN